MEMKQSTFDEYGSNTNNLDFFWHMQSSFNEFCPAGVVVQWCYPLTLQPLEQGKRNFTVMLCHLQGLHEGAAG